MKEIKQSGTDPETGQEGRKVVEMITKLFGDPETFKQAFCAQDTQEQRNNLTTLFNGRFAVDKKK